MRYAFVIDQNRCIGCHACTVACKEEHDVPIGVNRTWVKYIEKGRFPDTSRHFAVLRCNHCADAPCVTICPTVALFKRDDGIVDFDGDRCIGCKSCMQACPYDALYINPNTNTAAKCNFCAHRVESNIQPACEIVCPVQAITSGDLDDPTSRVSAIVAGEKTTVRKPHMDTDPQVYYVGVDKDVLRPARLRAPDTYMWADKYPGEDTYTSGHSNRKGNTAALETYDVPHPVPWGWKIGAYLWTKSIAAGVLLIAALLHVVGGADLRMTNVIAPLIALAFTGVTTGLLVIDLKRPERFHYLLIKPNLRSWLVLGGYILMAYGAAAAAWLVPGIGGRPVPPVIVVAAAVLALAAACYSAFLFAQAKGRDLWQSPTFLWHLALQALAAGAATTILVGVVLGSTMTWLFPVGLVLLLALGFALATTLMEGAILPMSEDARSAHDIMTRGALRVRFWVFAVGFGMLLPVVILAAGVIVGEPSPASWVAASAFALIGLWIYEQVWVAAGQAVPLS